MTQCPACNTPLRLVVERGIDIDVCDQCHGVWLDPGELDALSDSNEFTPINFTDDELVDLKCPRCHNRNFISIEIDEGAFARCADCGGIFVGGKTLDCISKKKPPIFPSKEKAENTMMSIDSLYGLVDLLWLFTHH